MAYDLIYFFVMILGIVCGGWVGEGEFALYNVVDYLRVFELEVRSLVSVVYRPHIKPLHTCDVIEPGSMFFLSQL